MPPYFYPSLRPEHRAAVWVLLPLLTLACLGAPSRAEAQPRAEGQPRAEAEEWNAGSPYGQWRDHGREASAAPSVRINLAETSHQQGETFVVEVRVRWPEQHADYILYPPRLALPEGLEKVALTAESGSDLGPHALAYRFEILAREAGRYELGPVEVRYAPNDGVAPRSLLLSGPEVRIEASERAGIDVPALLTGSGPGGSLGGLLLLLVVGAAGAAAFVLARRQGAAAGGSNRGSAAALAEAKPETAPRPDSRRRTFPASTAAGPDEPDWDGLLTRLERARCWCLSDARQEAYLELAAVAEALHRHDRESRQGGIHPDGGSDVPHLDPDKLERARYAGWAPEAEETADLARRLEACLVLRAPRCRGGGTPGSPETG